LVLGEIDCAGSNKELSNISIITTLVRLNYFEYCCDNISSLTTMKVIIFINFIILATRPKAFEIGETIKTDEANKTRSS
jgi:hypothetical protein